MRLPVTPTVRGRLFAVGLIGALLGLAVLWTAVSQFSHVHRSDRRAAQLSRAQRDFQDADQAHDAMHADVLDVLRVAGQPEAARGRAVLEADAVAYQRGLDRVREAPLPDQVSEGLVAMRPVQLAYVASARRIGLLAVTAPAQAVGGLDTFNDDFLRLQQAQARVTDQLAAAETSTTSRANHVQDAAEERIVVTTAVALAGLLVLALLLQRAGARVQQANARLAERLARERRIAETLQRSLLPKELPEIPGAVLAGRFLPTEEGAQVGGDWYDVFPLEGRNHGLVIGDVVGHDIAAAAMMGQLRPALRSLAREPIELAEVFNRVSRELIAFEPGQTATCILVRLDEATDQVVLANAGHCPPLIVAADGTTRYLEGRICPPLGAVPGFPYVQQTGRLSAGDTLLLYTDGLVERRGADLAEQLARLEQAAAAAAVGLAPGSPGELCDRVMAALFEGEKPPDDVAMLAVTRTPVPVMRQPIGPASDPAATTG